MRDPTSMHSQRRTTNDQRTRTNDHDCNAFGFARLQRLGHQRHDEWLAIACRRRSAARGAIALGGALLPRRQSTTTRPRIAFEDARTPNACRRRILVGHLRSPLRNQPYAIIPAMPDAVPPRPFRPASATTDWSMDDPAPGRQATQDSPHVAAAPRAQPISPLKTSTPPASDAMICERCGKAEMYRMHAVWRCPECGFKTDCCGW